jgi:hypothetical protein
MGIFLVSGRMNGFKKWSNDHRPTSNDDDSPGGATPVAIAIPPTEDSQVMDERLHRPWRVPGTGTSL